jgi:hypothetical protein
MTGIVQDLRYAFRQLRKSQEKAHFADFGWFTGIAKMLYSARSARTGSMEAAR